MDEIGYKNMEHDTYSKQFGNGNILIFELWRRGQNSLHGLQLKYNTNLLLLLISIFSSIILTTLLFIIFLFLKIVILSPEINPLE